MRRQTLPAAGFTLIEMMIVVVILGIVTAQLFVVFGNQKKVFSSNERTLDVQESTRLTLDLISYDARMAGFMVPTWAAVSSVDGGKDHADRLCVSSSSFVAPNNPTMTDQIERFPAAFVTAVSGGGVVTVDTLDIDGDGNPDIIAGQPLIVASPSKTFCARIATIDVGNQITFAAPENAFNYLGAATSDMRAVPANIYELNENTLELRRNTLLLASQVEDFQVEYWLDYTGGAAGGPDGVESGDLEFPVNDLIDPDPPGGPTAANNEAIRRVRVSITARTIQEDGTNAATGHLQGGRPKLANRDADPVPDLFRRRSFSASILPRNIIAASDEGL